MSNSNSNSKVESLIPRNNDQRLKPQGFFGIGIENLNSAENLGTLFRTALRMGASFIFTVGKKYKQQVTDTTKTHLNIPLFQYADLDEFLSSQPKSCKIVGVEIADRAQSLVHYEHFTRSIYLLGSESVGLSQEAMDACHDIIYVPATGCLNVAVTGSIVLYDRIAKEIQTEAFLNR